MGVGERKGEGGNGKEEFTGSRGKEPEAREDLGRYAVFITQASLPYSLYSIYPTSSLIQHNELCLSKKRQENRNRREKQGGDS